MVFTEVKRRTGESFFGMAWNYGKKINFFGAGLGAFITQEYLKYGEGHTIHNGFIWLGAELGIIGGLLFFNPRLAGCV